MDTHEAHVTQRIAQLQTELADLEAGRPMNRAAALELSERLPALRAAVADRLIAIGILRADERGWV